jgi:hypothetical protein
MEVLNKLRNVLLERAEINFGDSNIFGEINILD